MAELAINIYQLAKTTFEKAEQIGRVTPAHIDAPPKKARKVRERYRFEQTEPAPVAISPRPTAAPAAARLIRRTSLIRQQEMPVYTLQTEDQPRIIIETERVLGFTALSGGQPVELLPEAIDKVKGSLEEIEDAFNR